MRRYGQVGRAVFADRRGVTAMEYALIAMLIAAAIIGGVTALGTTLSVSFSKIASSVGSTASK